MSLCQDKGLLPDPRRPSLPRTQAASPGSTLDALWHFETAGSVKMCKEQIYSREMRGRRLKPGKPTVRAVNHRETAPMVLVGETPAIAPIPPTPPHGQGQEDRLPVSS